MCGIAGIVGRFSRDEASRALAAMLRVQVHRGPDDEGMTVLEAGENVVALGNRRLAILDLSPLGHQPMVNPDTGDVLAYNGEIYNFLELRDELRGRFAFRGRSDTEVLLRAYQRWGAGCLERLKGMFALALWDARRARLLLARDHLGIKPLYFAAAGGGTLFASEVRALAASGLIAGGVNPQALAGYLAYGAVQEPLAILEGVAAAPPGAWLELDSGGQIAARQRYWDFPAPDERHRQAPLGRLVEEGRAILERAVQRHLVSDVPLGVFLSSGLDSTAVLGMAARRAGGQVHAFTVSFPEEPGKDEAPVARGTAARLGVTHHECPVDSATALGWTESALDSMDQPSMDGVNTYIVSRAVRQQGIVAALSGQGGDEVFGGYDSFRKIPRWLSRVRWLRKLPPHWRAALAAAVTIHKHNVFRQKAHDVACGGDDVQSIYFHFRRLLSDAEMAAFGLEPAALGLTRTFHVPGSERPGCQVAGDAVATVGRLECAYYLGNTLLRDGDVFGMANSLEIRVPFLDRDLVEWALRLPGDVLSQRGENGKFLLRRMCLKFYDPVQIGRPKLGFAPPFSLWLRRPLREMSEDLLAVLKRCGLLPAPVIDAVRARYLREPDTAAWSRLWALVALGHWIEKQKCGCGREELNA